MWQQQQGLLKVDIPNAKLQLDYLVVKGWIYFSFYLTAFQDQARSVKEHVSEFMLYPDLAASTEFVPLTPKC